MKIQPPPDPRKRQARLEPIPPGLLPAVEATVDVVIAELRQSATTLACRHIVGDDSVHVCAAHPAAGAMCWPCFRSHADRHAAAVEHRCDACQSQGQTMRPIVARRPTVLVAATTAGRPILTVGGVEVACLGICELCAEGLDLVGAS